MSSTIAPDSAVPASEGADAASADPCAGDVMTGVAGATVSTRTVRDVEREEVPPAFVAVAV
jgi:hypothetical protein